MSEVLESYKTERKVEEKPIKIDPVSETIANLIQNLLTSSNELAFELATIECDKWKDCPICNKARELVKLIKELFKLQKEYRR